MKKEPSGRYRLPVTHMADSYTRTSCNVSGFHPVVTHNVKLVDCRSCRSVLGLYQKPNLKRSRTSPRVNEKAAWEKS